MLRVPRTLVGFHKPLLRGTDAKLHLEAFLDLLCPFSKRQYLKLKELLAYYQDQRATPISFSFVNAVQPWHPQAFYISHVLAATNLAAQKRNKSNTDETAFRVIDKFYELQDKYSDEAVADRTPKDLLNELKKVAAEAAGNVTEEDIDALLKDDASLLYTKIQIKYARQNSVHVTPTISINGLIEPSISSSWDINEWNKLLDPLIQ
jgi:protein-disulfide isomerase